MSDEIPFVRALGSALKQGIEESKGRRFSPPFRSFLRMTPAAVIGFLLAVAIVLPLSWLSPLGGKDSAAAGAPQAPGSPSVTSTVATPTGTLDAADGEGALWAVGYETVWKIDTTTNQVVDQIAVSGSSDYRRITAGDGAVWVIDSGTRVLTKIDPVSDAVVGRTSLNGAPVAITIGAAGIWVTLAEEGSPQLVQIDPASGAPTGTPIPAAPGTQQIAIGTNSVVAVNEKSTEAQMSISSRHASFSSLGYSALSGTAAISLGQVWFVTSAQHVFHASLSGGPVSRLPFDRIEQLAYSDGWLWLLQQPPSQSAATYTVQEGAHSLLLQVDPSSGRIVHTLPVRGIVGSRIAVGSGVIWIADGTEIERVELTN